MAAKVLSALSVFNSIFPQITSKHSLQGIRGGSDSGQFAQIGKECFQFSMHLLWSPPFPREDIDILIISAGLFTGPLGYAELKMHFL